MVVNGEFKVTGDLSGLGDVTGYGYKFAHPSKTIHKYPLKLQPNTQLVEIPMGAVLLTVQLQREQPVLWAMVYPNAPKVPRMIRVFGTGHEIDGDEVIRQYLGTIQQHAGLMVWHWFEVAP